MKLKKLLISISICGIIWGVWSTFFRVRHQAAKVATQPAVTENKTATSNPANNSANNPVTSPPKHVNPPQEPNASNQLTSDQLAKINQQIAEYSTAINANGKDKLALYDRAELYLKKGFYDDAVADYSALIQQDNKDIKAYFYRAIAQTNRNNILEAIGDYNKVISLDPKRFVAYNNRGLLYLNKRDFDQAGNDFDKALSLNPQYTEAYYNRALLSLEAKDFADAVKDLTQALTLHDANDLAFEIRIRYRLAIALYNQSKYQDALTHLNIVVNLSPKDPKLYELRALTNDQLGNRQQAFDDRNKAQELNLNNML